MSKKKTKETVDHPDHYNKGIEVIDFIESWDFDFATGNIIKYVARHKFKEDPMDDLKKARWYIDRLIETYEEQKFQSIYGMVKSYEAPQE